MSSEWMTIDGSDGEIDSQLFFQKKNLRNFHLAVTLNLSYLHKIAAAHLKHTTIEFPLVQRSMVVQVYKYKF